MSTTATTKTTAATTTRTVISVSNKRAVPRGSQIFKKTEMVVYKTPVGKGKFTSVTKHEINFEKY